MLVQSENKHTFLLSFRRSGVAQKAAFQYYERTGKSEANLIPLDWLVIASNVALEEDNNSPVREKEELIESEEPTRASTKEMRVKKK